MDKPFWLEKENGIDVLYADISAFAAEVEFAAELAAFDEEYAKELLERFLRGVSERFPKAGAVKLVAAGTLIAALSVSLPPGARREFAGAAEKYNMSYVFFGSIQTQISHLNRTKGALNAVSPSYFDLDEGGSLVITASFSADFIDNAHRNNVSVIPFLSNHWDRAKGRAALLNREALSTQIANAVHTHGLDGVNVDIENVTEDDRFAYTDFVRLLREKLGGGKELSVAVAANPKGWKDGWHGSYDYAGLSRYADYLMVMAYDESYQGGPSGAVASFSFVEDSIKYAIKHAPPEKIVLGLPLFGRYWKLGSGYGGDSLTLTQAYGLIESHRSSVFFDGLALSPVAYITISAGEEKPVISGKTLGAGTYVIWYENDESIKTKLMLIDKYGLKGSGTWSLGQENTSMWNYYLLWLNGRYFTDIASSWAGDDIQRTVALGLMEGVGAGRFAPERPLTRAEAAAILARRGGYAAPPGYETSFGDTGGHWAREEIAACEANGIFVGVEQGRFMPDMPLTREQTAMLLTRVLGLSPAGAPISFADVDSGSWSAGAIASAASRGIFEGYPDNSFRPQAELSRAQMAALLARISDEFK